MDAFQIQQMLQNLRNQVQSIEQIVATPHSNQFPLVQLPPTPDISELVKLQVEKEMARYRPVPKVEALPPPTKPDLKSAPTQMFSASLLECVGEALSEEQQVWLSANLLSLPTFLKSPKAQGMISTFVEMFKQAQQ